MKVSGTTAPPPTTPRPGPGPLRALVAILASAALGLALAQSATTDPFFSDRGYFVGHIGDAPIQMDLRIDGARVSGWYFYDRVGRYIDLDGTLEFGTLTIEESVEGRVTGVFEGEVPWSPQGNVVLEGTWRSPSDSTLPFRLTRVADFASLALEQGPIEAHRSLPFFLAGELQALNGVLHERALPDLIEFFEAGRNLQINDEFYFGWSLDESTTIRYLDETLVSAMSNIYIYTGGAHGNTFYRSFNLWRVDGPFREVTLADLFEPSSDYLQRLSGMILEQLREFGASDAVDGRVTMFEEADLSVFEISPEGLTFAFAPYQVASYVEGSFFVTLAYDTIADMVALEGPLGRFMTPD